MTRPIGPLKPFACTSRENDRSFGLTLYATGWAAIEHHCRQHWPHVRVEGLLIETHEWAEMPEHMEGSA